jgi:dTDP-4-amino-4,6-dideoxygalactose transaminase
MDALWALARRRGLRVIEDAALVLGSQWRNRNIGAQGDLVTFSFHPNKNITTIEGGALVVNDAAEAKRVDALRFHGIEYLADRTRDVAFPGGKFSLPDVNAGSACATRSAARVPGDAARTRRRYFERFARPPGVRSPAAAPRRRRTDVERVLGAAAASRMSITRKAFRAALDAHGIGTGMSYEALHLCTLGRQCGCGKAISVTERIAAETVAAAARRDDRGRRGQGVTR